MTMRAIVLLALLAAPALAESVTPVQKVLQMMDDMLQKGKKEKSEEQVTFSTYKQFCQSTSAEKTRDIGNAKDAIIQLQADIEKAGADAMLTAKELRDLGVDMDEWGAQKAEAQGIRAKEKADFLTIQAEYTDAIDATERALQVLKSSPGQFLQVKESLLQISALDRAPAHAKQVIMSFLQSGNQDPALALLEESTKQTPKNYESSSGSIIDMVKDLRNKFKEEKYVIEQEEAKKRHASDMVVQDLTDNLERAGKESDAKTAFKSQREKDGAEAEGNLADTKASLAEDTNYLAELTKECATKAADYEKRQVIRAGEIEALMKATEIMSGAAVGGGTQHLPSLVQAASLVQLRSNGQSPVQSRVAGFLKERAHRSGSKILSLIAVRVAEDPFKKISKMISDMISKLMEEANEEAEHKGFCDTEMGTNKNTRDTKTEEVETLTALSEELTAAISQLGREAAQLADEITAIDNAVFEATSVRNTESAKNTQTVADAQVASEATARALQVLKDFYSQNAGPAQSSSSTGILGMLEVIQSDFVRLETETTSSEDDASKAFTAFSRESSKDKAVKETDMKHKTNGKITKEGDLETAKKDLAGTQEELDAALAYFEKLKPSCVEAGESYEERVARRKEEIESLTDALKILEDTQ